ncbi:GntR family transcriptional regulator [Actinomyces sp.]|uniref:GntR family transcriptional regulator n=1 Tax=Actinomyces sp. TaxID=29317 RepID=UPI0026DBFB4B|nr:GntR family transcriptional regulator [Actinomyces sp.]MDO4901242.1 GntR family transcriptional regulator [Actinomyces sp.]
MDLEVDPLSPTPIYQQIRDRIVEGIARGELPPGQRLPSVRALAGAFAINPATVSKAYDLLRAEGLVVINAKSGTVVAPSTPWADAAAWQSRLRTLLAEARAHGLAEKQILDATAHQLDALSPVRSVR